MGRLADRRRSRDRRARAAGALWAHDHHALWASRGALAAAGIRATRTIRRAAWSGATRAASPTASSTKRPPGSSRTTSRAPTATTRRPAIADPRPASSWRSVSWLSTTRALVAPDGARCRDRGYRRSPSGACFRSGSMPASARSRSTRPWQPARSGDPLGGDPAWPRAPRLAEALRRRDARVPDGRAPRTDRDGGGPPAARRHGARRVHHRPDGWPRSPPRAAAAGIATIIHAIGDPASGPRSTPSTPVGQVPLMPRLEHVQLLHPDDRATSPGPGSRPRSSRSTSAPMPRRPPAVGRAGRGERLHVADPGRHRGGARLRDGCAVEPIDPWPGLAMAVTRSDPSWPAGTPPFGPERR